MTFFNFKKLSFKQSYLSLEKKDVEMICDKNNIILSEYMQENYPNQYRDWIQVGEQEIKEKIKETIEKDSDTSTTKKSLVKNKDLKKLYRKIAEKTHPDKVGSNKYSDIFTSASAAYQENNLGVLIKIAEGLNIEIIELSSESILLLEENIKFLEDDILARKKSIAWLWETANSEEEKTKLIQMALMTRGIFINE